MSKLVTLGSLIAIVVSMSPAHADDLVNLESKTKHYRLTLEVGPIETMYSAADAKAKHPSSGEVMLSGKMSGGMAGMDQSAAMPGMLHVELHVHSLKTGKVVTNARVKLTVTGSDKKRRRVPIARMYGVTEGLDDLHYGNNVMLGPGAYTVDATVNGEAARYAVTIPGGS